MEPPGSGVYTPVRILTRVDFPQPFCPTRPCSSPGATLSWTPRSTRADPKVFDRSATLSRWPSTATPLSNAPQLGEIALVRRVAEPVTRGLGRRGHLDAADVLRGEQPRRE